MFAGVSILAKKGDASLDAIKGMRCGETGERFGGVVHISWGFLCLGSLVANFFNNLEDVTLFNDYFKCESH